MSYVCWKDMQIRAALCYLGAGLLVLTTGCNRLTEGKTGSQAAQEQAPAVTAVKPERRTLRRTIEQPARVEPFEETPLFARIPGYVRKVLCDIGDRVQGPRQDDKGNQVEPGQVLAELWVPEIEKELKQKRALV